MKNNLRRHKLLRILTDKYIKGIQPGEIVIGVSWDELTTKMNCSLDTLIEISAPLFDEKEIDKYQTYGIEGAYATMKGVSSYSTQKYRRENTKLIFEGAKNWVQTIIPLLSLTIALYALVISEIRIRSKDNEIDKLNIRLEELEEKSMDFDNKVLSTMDTLKIKR